MSTEKRVRINVNLTQLTHRQFKVWCIEAGKTLQDGVEHAVKEQMKRKLGAAAAEGMVEVAPGVWRDPQALTSPPSPKPARPITSPPSPKSAPTLPRVVADEGAPIGSVERTTWEYLEYSSQLIDEISVEDFMQKREGIARKMGWPAGAAAEPDTPPWDVASEYTVGKPGPVEVDEVPKGPVTAAEFEVPANWVDRGGVSRAVNLARYGEDEAIEYWPPILAPGLNVDAEIDTAAIAGLAGASRAKEGS